jgi:hypothetical protein
MFFKRMLVRTLTVSRVTELSRAIRVIRVAPGDGRHQNDIAVGCANGVSTACSCIATIQPTQPNHRHSHTDPYEANTARILLQA